VFRDPLSTPQTDFRSGLRKGLLLGSTISARPSLAGAVSCAMGAFPGRYPDNRQSFSRRPDVKAHDEASYAGSLTSLVSFPRRSARRALSCAVCRNWQARRMGGVALQSQYGIQSVGELQAQWQYWLKKQTLPAVSTRENYLPPIDIRRFVRKRCACEIGHPTAGLDYRPLECSSAS